MKIGYRQHLTLKALKTSANLLYQEFCVWLGPRDNRMIHPYLFQKLQQALTNINKKGMILLIVRCCNLFLTRPTFLLANLFVKIIYKKKYYCSPHKTLLKVCSNKARFLWQNGNPKTVKVNCFSFYHFGFWSQQGRFYKLVTFFNLLLQDSWFIILFIL